MPKKMLGPVEYSLLMFCHNNSQKDQSCFYVVRDDVRWEKFQKAKKPSLETFYKRADCIDLDNDGDFWLCYVDDSHDPSLTIVRAESLSDAEESFVTTNEDADLDEDALKDYSDKEIENLPVTDRGTVYDSSMVMVAPLRLCGIEPVTYNMP